MDNLLTYILLLSCFQVIISRVDQSFETIDTSRKFGFQKLLKCSLLNDEVTIEQKYQCLKEVAEYQEWKILSRSQKLGPDPMKLAVVMFFSTDILASYALYAIAVNLFYCIFNDYAIKIFDEDIFKTNPQLFDQIDYRWNKVKVIEQLLWNDQVLVDSTSNRYQNDYDYYLWVDADYIFLDMHFRIESILFDYPNYHFYASAELSGSTTLINSGAFLVRHSLWSKHLLQQWWNFSHRHLYSDQEQFDLLYAYLKQHPQTTLSIDRIKILDVNRINTDPPAMTKHASHHQVLHLMGEESFFRKAIFTTAYQSIHQYLIDYFQRFTHSHPEEFVMIFPTHQLGITRSFLLSETIRLYGQEITILLQDFADKLDMLQVQSYETCRHLSNIVHHYAHAVEYQLQHLFNTSSLPSLIEIKEIRKQVYQLLYRNIELLKQSTLKFTSDHLETIKSGIIAGQHVLHDDQTLSISQRLEIARELLSLIQYLITLAHPLQRSSLEMIQSSIYIEMTLLLLREDRYYDALQSVEQALILTEQHAIVSGNHLLFQPLLMQANCFAILERNEEAMTIYERCLTFLQSFNNEEDNMENHQFFDYEIQIYYNYGLLLMQPRKNGFENSNEKKTEYQHRGRSYLELVKQRLETYYCNPSQTAHSFPTFNSMVCESSLHQLMTIEHYDLYRRVIAALSEY